MCVCCVESAAELLEHTPDWLRLVFWFMQEMYLSYLMWLYVWVPASVVSSCVCQASGLSGAYRQLSVAIIDSLSCLPVQGVLSIGSLLFLLLSLLLFSCHWGFLAASSRLSLSGIQQHLNMDTNRVFKDVCCSRWTLVFRCVRLAQGQAGFEELVSGPLVYLWAGCWLDWCYTDHDVTDEY